VQGICVGGCRITHFAPIHDPVGRTFHEVSMRDLAHLRKRCNSQKGKETLLATLESSFVVAGAGVRASHGGHVLCHGGIVWG
jgi:hypothetical protein